MGEQFAFYTWLLYRTLNLHSGRGWNCWNCRYEWQNMQP
jgi:hypothetical protein